MDKFLIAPINSGLVKNITPWLAPSDAFLELNNAFIFRGKVQKRPGQKYTGYGFSSGLEQLGSRLRIYLGDTDTNGDISGTVPGAIFKAGQIFSIGSEIFTVSDTGTPVTMLTTGSSTTHTFDTTSGNYDIKGSEHEVACYFYPTEPVMELTFLEDSTINYHTTIAFDTQFAYYFDGNSWLRLGTAVWHGNNYNYFWSTTFQGTTAQKTCLFTTNFNKTTPDPMKYYDGTSWTDFTPKFLVAGASQNLIETAKIMVIFKGRLVLLNTYEDYSGVKSSFVNRCRFSWVGNVLATEAFYEVDEAGAGGGGYLDAPTKEEIISAEFIRDKLIVYFEHSTWELAYTGNQILPFIWQKLNTELGSQSTFSSIPFDRGILNIGQTGIHVCNGVNVERIDDNIPDDIFYFLKDYNQVNRIQGIRDYQKELVFWTLPKNEASDTYSYSDIILVYNYQNQTWAYFDDSITTFGYTEQSTEIDSEYNHNKLVIAGNHHGFVFYFSADTEYCASVLQVSKIASSVFSVFNHNLKTGDFVKIDNCGTTVTIGRVEKEDENTLKIKNITTGTYASNDLYSGGGTLERLPRLDIKTEYLNPYIKNSKNLVLKKINFCVERTTSGEVTVDYYISSATGLDMRAEETATGTNMGLNTLDLSAYSTMEALQEILWHPVYFLAVGNSVQLRIYHTDTELQNAKSYQSFVLQGFILETLPAEEI